MLSYAEVENELNGPSAQVYDYLDQIRTRAGMPVVDRAKYASKEQLRERAVVKGSEFIENRQFAAKNRYLPLYVSYQSIQLIDNLSVEKIDDVVGVCGIVL